MTRRAGDSALDMLYGTLVKAPWWLGPILAVIAYATFLYLVPAIIEVSTGAASNASQPVSGVLVSISRGTAPFAAFLVIAVWGFAELKKLADRRRLDRQTGLESVAHLNWAEFEELVAEAFRRDGYVAERTGSGGGDDGYDVRLERDGRMTLVQCKHWRARKVGVNVVRELRGVMASHSADAGIVVTYGTFTEEAAAFARDSRMTLIGGQRLVEMIGSVQKRQHVQTNRTASRSDAEVSPTSAQPPACPVCSSPMVLRTARRGPHAGSRFWGCSRYPSCRGVRQG